MILSIAAALLLAQQTPRPAPPPLVLLPGSPADRKPDDYTFGPDSMVHEGVPQGTWDKITWKSEIFPDTERFVWTYVPAQYDPKKPACLMVIQDGVRQYAEREDNRPAGRKAGCPGGPACAGRRRACTRDCRRPSR